MLTFTAPSPNQSEDLPSRRQSAHLLRIAPSMLDQVDGAMIKKRQQLADRVSGVHWVLAKEKKGYSTISLELKVMLLDAFNNHPHVIVSPITKGTLLVKNADGETTAVKKILTMVGNSTTFINIIRDHPTIKKNLGKQVFRYIVSGLGCVR